MAARMAGRMRAMKACGLMVLVFALLLWARFLLVTGHPRTAVADPAPEVGAVTAAAAAGEAPMARDGTAR